MDSELQKFELQQCKERLGMIESFLPESFTRRGGSCVFRVKASNFFHASSSSSANYTVHT